MKKRNEVKALDRYLSRTDVWAMAFGLMVGWGVFAMPGTTFLPVAGPAGTVIAMLIGVVIILVIANNFSYLMGRTSITGGVYSYTKEAFGRDHAFISSWFLCLSYLTIVFLNGTALFLVIRIMMSDALEGSPAYSIAGNHIYYGETAASVIVLAAVGVLFVVAKPLLQQVQTVLAFALFIGVVLISAACLPRVFAGSALTDFGMRGLNPGYAIFSLVILAPWAFVGFEAAAFDTAHFKFESIRTKKVLFLSILAAAFAYLAMALVSIAALPEGFATWQDYFSVLDQQTGISSIPTFFSAGTVLGSAGLAVMTVTAVAAILTGIIGGYRATTRVLSTMAEDRILSEKFGETTYSILFIMILAIILSFFGRNTLNWFVDLTSFGAIVGFGYTSAAAWKIAKTESEGRVVVTGIIGTAISALFAVVQLVPRLAAMEAMGSEAFLLLSLWCLLGFVFYWRTVNKSSLTEFSGMSTSGVVLFALLLYSAIMWLAKRLMAAGSLEKMKSDLVGGGVILLIIIFVGLAVMLYVQEVVRKKHEAVEREKIRAVESSLAKSQFLFNMSHDIRTPMNAILGYTNLAKKENSPETIHDYLSKIEGSSMHLLALINDILEMSRIESGKIELEFVPVDLREIFEGMQDLFSEQMRQKQIDFNVYTGQAKNYYVWCDKKNLNRVLLNILSNAYKFTPEGGTIKASLWESGSGEHGYGSYEMRIQDSGIGMSKEFAEKMFNAFERERTSTVSGIEGTGLGLAITKSIVDLMGGTIEVLTAPGSGTEMIIRLKLRIAEEKDVRKPEMPAGGGAAEAVDFNGKRILLVEDNLINMEIAKEILTQMGFVVDTAENGKIAVDTIEGADAGTYDLVLMDIQMPVMDGYEATKAIRLLDDPKKAFIPVIAMTANAFKEDEEAAMAAGMQAHIAKPIDLEAMVVTLTKILSENAG